MTREEAIAELSVLHERLSNPKDCEDGCYSWEDGRYVEAIDMAIEALSKPNNTCGVDLIKREDAIDAVEKAKTARSTDGEIFCAKINTQMNIQHLPSVQLERERGEWIEVVRCKDCKYSKHLKQYPKVNTWKCILTDVVYRADDYCSYGERKEE